MTLDHEDTMSLIARLILLEHVVGVLIRERAIENGKTANDVARYAEDIKSFFEDQGQFTARMEAALAGAVDRFFQQISADIRNRENPAS